MLLVAKFIYPESAKFDGSVLRRWDVNADFLRQETTKDPWWPGHLPIVFQNLWFIWWLEMKWAVGILDMIISTF